MATRRYPGQIKADTNKLHISSTRRGLILNENACNETSLVQDQIYEQGRRPPPRRSKRNINMQIAHIANDESQALAENMRMGQTPNEESQTLTENATKPTSIERLGMIFPGRLDMACQNQRFFGKRFQYDFVSVDEDVAARPAKRPKLHDGATDAGNEADIDGSSDTEDFDVRFIGLKCLQIIHNHGKNTLSDPSYHIQNPPMWQLVQAAKEEGPHYRSIVPARLCSLCSEKAWSTSYCKHHSHWSRMKADDLVMTSDGRVGRVARDGHNAISTFSSKHSKFIKSIRIGYELNTKNAIHA